MQNPHLLHQKIRIIAQITFFAFFIALICIGLSYPLTFSIPTDIVYGVNPLVGFLTTIASRIFNPVLLISGFVMSAVAVVLGRVFCGFMCPLGTLIDFSDTYLTATVRHKNSVSPLRGHAVKYLLLFGIFVLAVFGILFPLFFDPLSLLTRIFTLVFYPAGSIIAHDAYQSYGALADRLHIETGLKTIAVPLYYGTAFALGMLMLILAAGIIRPRFFCQYICPTGAFLGLVGRRPLFRRIPDAGRCHQCSVCAKVCPTGAINASDQLSTRAAECIVCGRCNRPGECSRFGFSIGTASNQLDPDVKRRHSVIAIAAGIIFLPVFRATAYKDGNGTGKIIRPPGALPEEQFLRQCITCEACAKVCPTRAIQPSSLFDGFNRINTPKIVPRIGGCEEHCAACGHVCPTGAIRNLPESEKPFVKIGTAVIDQHKCIAWAQNRECLVCDESCPYNAIEFKLKETIKGLFKVPVVHEDLCMGCGRCEKACPVIDNAAIVVFNFGENRRTSGAYLTDSQKQNIRLRRNLADGNALSTTMTPSDPHGSVIKDVPKSDTEPYGAALKVNELPPGFE